MTNKQIVEDYKNGITHSEFSVFYCKELDEYIVRRMVIDAEEIEIVMRDFKEEGVPPEGYTIAVQNSGAIIKRKLEKGTSEKGSSDIVKTEIPIKKARKDFKEDFL
jgi:hypothetical protein